VPVSITWPYSLPSWRPSLKRRHHTQPLHLCERGEPKTFLLCERGEPKALLFLIQLDDWQAVDAENGGDFAAVMDVMFEHTPDDLLARNCGFHFSRTSRCIQPHLGEWLERRLDQLRVTHTFRLIQKREDLEKISRGQAGKRLLVVN